MKRLRHASQWCGFELIHCWKAKWYFRKPCLFFSSTQFHKSDYFAYELHVFQFFDGEISFYLLWHKLMPQMKWKETVPFCRQCWTDVCSFDRFGEDTAKKIGFRREIWTRTSFHYFFLLHINSIFINQSESSKLSVSKPNLFIGFHRTVKRQKNTGILLWSCDMRFMNKHLFEKTFFRCKTSLFEYIGQIHNA